MPWLQDKLNRESRERLEALYASKEAIVAKTVRHSDLTWSGPRSAMVLLLKELGCLSTPYYARLARKYFVEKGLHLSGLDAGYVQPTRSEKLKISRRDEWANLSDQEYKERICSLKKGQNSFYSNVELANCRSKNLGTSLDMFWDNLDDDAYAAICEKNKMNQVEYWHNLGPDGRAALLSKMLKGIAKYRTVPRITLSGKTVYLDSSWELAMYNQLEYLRMPFGYAGETGRSLDLIDRFWFPDFVFEDLGIIIEVKGLPFYERFMEKILMSFKASEYSEKFDVYLCRYSIKQQHMTFESLLDSCELVHLVNEKSNKIASVLRLSSRVLLDRQHPDRGQGD